ncbi:DNA replication ATP-dependent helicase/nuclease DNA2 [Schistosoma japonicum]|nr:DNA replication ATP-dependent helicase/nuclease DNA2 [Schistosoma japonicum]
MKQSSLLNFFGKKPEDTPSTSFHKSPSTDVSFIDSKSTICDDSYIITGTPNSIQRTSKISLTGRAALGTLQFDNVSSPSFRRHKLVPHRSSLTVCRDEIVRSKLHDLLSSDPIEKNENPRMCSNRQAQVSAKLRRGNYDLLNYAPQDQIVNVASNEAGLSHHSMITSNRAKMMVSTALRGCVASKHKSIPDVHSPEDLSIHQKCNKRNVSNPENKNISNSNKKAKHYVNSEIHLSVEELSALDDVLDQLIREDNLPSSEHCQKETVILDSPRTPDCSENDTQLSIHDEEFQMLNLSDWSPVKTESTMLEQQDAVDNQLFQIPSQSFLRGTVVQINNKCDQIELVVQLDNTDSTVGDKARINVILRDSWFDSSVRVNDIINIIPSISGDVKSPIRTDSTLIISDNTNSSHTDCAAICIHPDYLLPTTKVVSSLNCLRRVVLEQFWVSDGNYSENNEILGVNLNQTSDIMLTGSLVHELFQEIISKENIQNDDVSQIILGLIHRPSIVLQTYASGIKTKALIKKLQDFVPKIFSWTQAHWIQRLTPHTDFTVIDQVKVEDVVAIEENIWSNRLGLKGKIDSTLLCKVSSIVGSKPTLNLIPIELKTGNPSYSIEHKGQVYLYLLLAKEFYGAHYNNSNYSSVPVANAGWLVYLKESMKVNFQRQKLCVNPGILYPDINSFRGLIQTRNRLASGIIDLLKSADISHCNEFELPNYINQSRVCQTCSLQLTCSLLTENPTKSYSNACNSTSSIHEILINRRSHLRRKYITFFIKWSKLLLTEHLDNERLEDVVGNIYKTSLETNRPVTNGTIRGLQLMKTKISKNSLSGDFEVQNWFVLHKPIDRPYESLLSLSNLNVGDFVIVSSDDSRFLGIELATVAAVEECHEFAFSNQVSVYSSFDYKKHTLALISTRSFPDRIKSFRVDRYISMKTIQLNLSNLVGFMQNSKLCHFLRELIIDGRVPDISKTISKKIVKEIRPILKPLNVNQRSAVLQTLFSQNYILIKGYPGSGKTETLVALLRVLILLKKRILVAAHTHSAVDNLLLRLCQTGETRVIRLGQIDRINSDLFNYSLEYKLNSFLISNEKLEYDITDYIHSVMSDAVVVGCTALGASGGYGLQHPALTNQKFDVVLIDEASQLMFPTTLGPLLCLAEEQKADDIKCCRFVLVGDPYQLPPLVRSQKARLGGLDQSLFSLLLNYHDGAGSPSTTNSSMEFSKKGYIIELTIQYRMNSNILALTNYLTYENKMSCANLSILQATLELKPNVISDKLLDKSPLWIRRVKSPLLSDSVLLLDTKKLDCCTSSAIGCRASISNPTEAHLILYIIQQILAVFLLSAKDIGIITPHRAQVYLLKNILKKNSFETIEVNTVDQFQGRDKRVILLSLTVCPSLFLETGGNKSLESCRNHLLDDLPRLTVALTRAQHKLIIIGCTGHHDILQNNLNQKINLENLFSFIKSVIGGYEILPSNITTWINNKELNKDICA